MRSLVIYRADEQVVWGDVSPRHDVSSVEASVNRTSRTPAVIRCHAMRPQPYAHVVCESARVWCTSQHTPKSTQTGQAGYEP